VSRVSEFMILVAGGVASGIAGSVAGVASLVAFPLLVWLGLTPMPRRLS
jgi:uncharacterized membrane protein YfcA